ncbi:MAG TPA: NTP transferase domain-containing protein [Iamia sp.]
MSRPLVVVVQARAGSTRLPRKVLADLGGRPMLALMLARLGPLAADGATVVVATTTAGRDDAVAGVAEGCGVKVVRGDEADVLGRFAAVLAAHPADDVVRLTADCPLIDPVLVQEVVADHRRTGADYTSNTLVRTYPDGLDVEVLRADVLRRAVDDATGADEREHVTPHVYRRPRTFTLAQVTGDAPLGDERWTVDDADDLDLVREAVAALPDPVTAPWPDVLAALGSRPVRQPGDVVSRPAGAVDHRPGDPYMRRWKLFDHVSRNTLGEATVAVDDGIGTLTIDLPDHATDRRPAAVDAVRHRLRADLQVAHLHDPIGDR